MKKNGGTLKGTKIRISRIWYKRTGCWVRHAEPRLAPAHNTSCLGCCLPRRPAQASLNSWTPISRARALDTHEPDTNTWDTQYDPENKHTLSTRTIIMLITVSINAHTGRDGVIKLLLCRVKNYRTSQKVHEGWKDDSLQNWVLDFSTDKRSTHRHAARSILDRSFRTPRLPVLGQCA